MKSVRRGFTLLEMVIVIVVFSTLIMVVFNAYTQMINVKVNVEARQMLTERSYFLMEKLHVLVADYTIDYEEYYNRKIVGCDQTGVAGTGGVNGVCDLFTRYGNGTNNASSKPVMCSSDATVSELGVESYTDCQGSRNGDPQPYMSYAKTFFDVGTNVDQNPSVIGDEDDVDTGNGPHAIPGETSELFLISYNGDRRLFLRRALLGSGDWSGDGVISDTDTLYSLQQLQLIGVDAGYNHTFAGSGAFDGVMDTWLCDAQFGYVCSGVLPGNDALSTSYKTKNYAFAANNQDGWVDLLGRDVTLSDWSVRINPSKNHRLARADDSAQVSPSITLSLTTQLYGENRSRRMGNAQIESFSLPLQATFAMKEFYR